MKAIVFTKYGPPQTLRWQEVPRPIPKEGEVLVKVNATAINDYDWSLVRGKPYPYRLMFGLRRPKHQIPGMELSGVVEACGPGAQTFAVGDAVFGDTSDYGFGSFAEYVCIGERALAKKPDNISFEEAAALPHASLLAWQGLHELGKIRQGQSILINGAGGGVGTFGLQLAKLYDCEVTGVDTGIKVKAMKLMGFDRVIDYQQEDFTRSGVAYDLILDCKTNRSAFSYLRSLRPGGTYVTVGGTVSRLLQMLLLSKPISWLYKKHLRILSLKPNKGLERIGHFCAEGKIKCTIDGPHPLEKTPELLQYFGEGKHFGKVIVCP